jgi:hypothetical protein
LTQTLIASIERAGDHVVVVGVLALVAAVAAIVYWLVQLVSKRRVGRPHPDDESGGARRPQA